MHEEFDQVSGNHQSEADNIQLNSIEEAIEDIAQGKVVIVVDDENRENEGDFICAAECITPDIVNFMATYGRGLICTPLEEKRADELELPMMVNENTSLHATAFTISIDLIGQGCTTGISAHDRAKGIKALIDPATKPSDYARPGHIFPLRAKTGGVLRRTGHTEAAIDLARLAGFAPVGVLVEILNEDGTMARLPQLSLIAHQHGLKIISIKDLVAYRMKHERIIREEMSTTVDTKFGAFKVKVYKQETSGDLHIALIKGEIMSDRPTLVRVHSTTETDNIIGSLFSNYGERISRSLQKIDEHGSGVFLFMRHSDPERHRDLMSEIRRMGEPIKGKDDEQTKSSLVQKDYGVGAQILREVGVGQIALITGNPKKRVGLIGYGLEIVEHVPLFDA